MTWQTLVVGVVVASVSISLTVQMLSTGKLQNALWMRGPVMLFIVAVPAALFGVLLIIGEFQTITAEISYWREIIAPYFGFIFWILTLAFLPTLVILLFLGIFLLARTISCLSPEYYRRGTRDTSRACVLIGSSSLLIAGLTSLLTFLV